MIKYHDSLKYLLTILQQPWINAINLREVFTDQQVVLKRLT